MKKEIRKNLLEDTTEGQLPNFNSIEEKVFKIQKGHVYIGKEPIKPEFYSVMREQARYLLSSQLFEVLRATVINESAQLALVQSTDFEQVQFAKGLLHWQFVFDNILKKLTEIK